LLFPKQYSKELQITKNIYETVNKSHPSLGKLALMEVLSDIANKCLLVVGCSGTGKSAITKALEQKVRRHTLYVDAVTVQGLAKISKQLSNANITILVDDLSKGQTQYSQLATVLVFSELTYTGFYRKLTGSLVLEIFGFKGSAIINLQPLLLKKIIASPEFETDVRDKAIRYYHLHFPQQVNLNIPNIPIEIPSLEVRDYNIPEKVLKSELYKKALDNFEHEFTKARAREHLRHYLTASAKLNKRETITLADCWLIGELSKNFRLEMELFSKSDLEGERRLDVNVIPLLTALNTWKTPTIRDLCYRFSLKETRVRQIIEELHEYARQVKGHSKIFPTVEAKQLLQELGEWENG